MIRRRTKDILTDKLRFQPITKVLGMKVISRMVKISKKTEVAVNSWIVRTSTANPTRAKSPSTEETTPSFRVTKLKGPFIREMTRLV